MPRLFVYTNMWPQPGDYAGIFVREQVQELRERGWDIEVRAIPLAGGKFRYLREIPRARRAAKAFRPDILHVHFGLTLVSAVAIPRCPRFVTFHGTDVNNRRYAAIGRALSRPYHRIYVSDALRHAASDLAGRVLPMGVDTRLFRPGIAAKSTPQQVLFGADPTKQQKGYALFSRVLDLMKTSRPELTPVVLHGIGGGRSAVASRIAGSDLLLFTSDRGTEGSPMVLKEALACGVPVVSVNVGDAREVVTPSCGEVVDWGPDLEQRLAHAGLVALGGGFQPRLDERFHNHEVVKLLDTWLREVRG